MKDASTASAMTFATFDCGCAAPPPPVMRASTVPEPTQVAEAKLAAKPATAVVEFGLHPVLRSIPCCRRCLMPRGLRWLALPDRKRSAQPWLRKPPLLSGRERKTCTSRSKRHWSSAVPIARAPRPQHRICRPASPAKPNAAHARSRTGSATEGRGSEARVRKRTWRIFRKGEGVLLLDLPLERNWVLGVR